MVDPSTENIEALARAAGSGDEQAFGELVSRYRSWIYNTIYQILRNHDDALDVTQEAFIKAWKNLPSFRQSGGFAAWLRRIAVNCSIDFLRARKHWQESSWDELENHSGLQAKNPSPSEMMAGKEMAERMDEAINRLSPTHRTILLLREVENMSYEEISEYLDCSVGTVMSRLFHARKNLQRILGGILHET
jgi:RNA polymerase sigma-70 factor (ECF subfamily)